MLKFGIRKKGFTLIEVVISLLILEIILTPTLRMVLSSVKVNKNSEDKQKALYIAQQHMENQKSSESLNIGSQSNTEDGFSIITTVTDITSTLNTPVSEPNVVYDTSISIYSKDLDNYLSFNNGENTYEIKLNKDSANNLYITNDIDKITLTVNNGNPNPIDKSVTKNGDVFILFKQSNQGTLNIHAINNCVGKELSLYFAEQNRNEINYTLLKEAGTIRNYSNVNPGNSPGYLSANVYKIDIEVLKNGVSIQKITDFKNVIK